LDIVLKPGLARRVDPGLGRPGAGTGPGWRKNGGRKNPAWPSKTGCKLVDFCFFCFFTKTTSFWFFKKKLTRPTQWPGQNPKPGPWTGPGLKTMGMVIFFNKNQIEPKIITPNLKWQRATTKISWFFGFVGHVSLMMITRPIYRGHAVKRHVFI